MIAPHELRLGNYVKYRGSIYKVLSIVNTSNTKEESYYVDLNFVHRHLKGIDTREVEPIYLNEDWLLKFGFKPAEFHDFLYKNIFIINYGGKYYRAYLDGKTRIDVELKYVHQLQNLIHSICGEELKIKES